MLFNISRYDREIERQIKLQVGPSYSWKERLRLRGIGSPRMQIVAATPAITELCEKHNNTSYANIELRPLGILIGFKAVLETWVWAISYGALVIDFDKTSIVVRDNQNYMHLTYPTQDTGIGPFIEKLTRIKDTYALPE